MRLVCPLEPMLTSCAGERSDDDDDIASQALDRFLSYFRAFGVMIVFALFSGGRGFFFPHSRPTRLS